MSNRTTRRTFLKSSALAGAGVLMANDATENAATAEDAMPKPLLCIKNGLIHNGIQKEPILADILVENGKIKQIAKGIGITSVMDVFDAKDLQVFPGFVDCHSHIGLDGTAVGYPGDDYNERTDVCTPHIRAIDGINPMDPAFRKAALAGVTTVSTGPGSSNVLGGTFTAMKTVGRRIDDMIVKDPVAMKCAFGENPKAVYRESATSSRMTIAATLRNMLFKAREYMRKLEAAGNDDSKKPAFDMKLEALLPVLRKEIPLKAHAHQANDFFTAIRIAKEFDVNLTLEHVTDGHLVIEELVQEDYPLAIGPTLGQAEKYEQQYISWETPGALAKAGCRVSIITDAPVIVQEALPQCAGYAVAAGMDPFAALQAITINPARHLGIEDRVGSLEVGKDADIVVTNGSPFEISTKVLAVYINGAKVR